MISVYADRRWPIGTSIRSTQEQYEARVPANMKIIDLNVRGRIGSVFSPIRISQAIQASAERHPGVFFSAGFMPPAFSSIPAVVVVHDLAHLYAYDIKRRIYYKTIMRYLYNKCSQIICVSDFTKTQLLDLTGMDSKRVHVVYNGPPDDLDWSCAAHDPGYPYIFYFGHHRKHKNLARMVRAFCESRLPRSGYRFLITNDRNSELTELANDYGLSDAIHFVGFLSKADLASHIKGARIIAYASTFEGFGLPILEGFSAGTPVVTSNVTSMPEVAGGAAFLVDPFSISSISEGFEMACEDNCLRDKLITSGRRRLKDFSWDQSAKKLWGIVEQTI